MTLSLNREHSIAVPISNDICLNGLFYVPENALGLVLFVHGSGSSRFSIRNNYVARVLNKANLGTLLFDLLTPEEEAVDLKTREFRFNIDFLASRLINATNWSLEENPSLPIGYFGASTGGAAALIAAAKLPDLIEAVVSRGGRPDLADEFLPQVKAPTLLIVGGNDDVVIKMNEEAMARMLSIKKLEIVPGATHLFEETGTLSEAANLAKKWFVHYLNYSS